MQDLESSEGPDGTRISVEQRYRDLYSENDWFQNQYRTNRREFYDSVLKIVQDSKVTRCLDVGCSYGLMVELMNQHNIDASGVELHIDELVEFHKGLPYSKGKFLYGSANDQGFIDSLGGTWPGAIAVIETLRYLENPGLLARLKPELIIIREISNNRRNRTKRAQEFDIRLYSPVDLLQIFPEYECWAIYFFRSSLKINKPLGFVLHIINGVFPSYTVVLKRKTLSANGKF
jgi:hypothetical protein